MDKERKRLLEKILQGKNLDLILVYSNQDNYSFDLALNKTKPVLFHYYYISKQDEGYLELSYLVEELNSTMNLQAMPIEESSVEENLADFINGKYQKIGIIGNAPWKHLKKIRAEIIDISEEANELLYVKDTFEIDKIKKSAKQISEILDNLDSKVLVGKTEKEIKNLIMQEIFKNSEGLAFPVCITSGERTKKMTSSMPTERKINEKDIVIIDAGLIKEGFYSDCTRTYIIGNSKLEKEYKKLVNAHKEVIKKIKPSLSLKDLVGLYKEELKKENLPSDTLEVNDLGHGIGFYVHENPIFYFENQKDFKLKKNMIITLEPEISINGQKIRIEDMILIKEKSEILT